MFHDADNAVMTAALDPLRAQFRGDIRPNEPLGKFTSFRIGGPADWFIEPAGREDVLTALRYAQKEQIPLTIVGYGSNLLIADTGVRGIVMNLEAGLNTVRMDGNLVMAEAGVRIGKFVDFCIQQSKAGVEMLAGIPGTIGGAVVMNAGAYGGETADHLVDVECVRTGEIVRVPKSDAEFSYRRSSFRGDIVLSARFDLPQGDLAGLLKRRRELLVKRNESQPLNLPNSGSVFKNPPGNFAAKLIEQAGLKGTRIGNAQISEKHGNFIVNHGNAGAADVLGLILLAKKTVREQFGVTLEPEVQLMGFPQDVLNEVYAGGTQ